jgi:hypothetical protein
VSAINTALLTGRPELSIRCEGTTDYLTARTQQRYSVHTSACPCLSPRTGQMRQCHRRRPRVAIQKRNGLGSSAPYCDDDDDDDRRYLQISPRFDILRKQAVVVHIGNTYAADLVNKTDGWLICKEAKRQFCPTAIETGGWRSLAAAIQRDDSLFGRKARLHEYEATSEIEITESLRAVESLQAKQARDIGSALVVHPNNIDAHVATVGGALLSVLLLPPTVCLVL